MRVEIEILLFFNYYKVKNLQLQYKDTDIYTPEGYYQLNCGMRNSL